LTLDEILDAALRKMVAARVSPSKEEAKHMLLDAVVGLIAVAPGSTPTLKYEALRAFDSLLGR